MIKKHVLLLSFLVLIFSQHLLFSNTVFNFADFDDGKADRNNLGFVASAFQNSGGICTLKAESDYANVYGQSGYSLRLDYDVRVPGSFCGYYSKIHSMDMSSYKYLTFYAKGLTGKELFKVQLKVLNGDANSSSSSVYVSDFIDGGLSTGWKKVVIPLDAFINLKSLTQVDEIVFVFENSQSGQNESVLKSSIFIDNIVFGTKFLGYLPVNNFGTMNSSLPIGGNTGAGGNNGWISNVFSSSIYDLSPNSLQLNYNVNAGSSYAFYFMILGGGSDGVTKLPKDLRNYDSYSFNIKAVSPALNPCGIKVEIHDYINPSAQPFYRYLDNGITHITPIWQKFSTSLTNFKNVGTLDKSKIQELAFTFENANVSNSIGTVYVDEIQFESSSFSNKLAIPQKPWSLMDNGQAINDNFVLNNNSKLIVSAGSSSSDPLLESVRFEFSQDGANWHVLKRDYDVSGTSHEVDVNPDNFSGNNLYYLRVVSENIWGNTNVLGPFKSIQVAKTGFSDDRPGKLICKFSIDNNPFSPNGDGIKETAVFHYMLLSKADISFRILNTSGEVVYKKEIPSQPGGTDIPLTWDGKDLNNNIVKNGVYYYKISAKGADGTSDKIIQVIGVIK